MGALPETMPKMESVKEFIERMAVESAQHSEGDFCLSKETVFQAVEMTIRLERAKNVAHNLEFISRNSADMLKIALLAQAQSPLNELVKERIRKEAFSDLIIEIESNENIIQDSNGRRPLEPELFSINRKKWEEIKLKHGFF